MRKKVPRLNVNAGRILVCILMIFSVSTVVANNSLEKLEGNLEATQERTIRGTVLDASGTPIMGANVVEVGTTNGIATDFDGNFELKLTNSTTKN